MTLPIVLALLILSHTLLLTQANQLNVSIYYEAFCPDSNRFYTKNFYPIVDVIGDYLNVDLVPFGKASMSNVSGHWEFTCQHGPQECYADKVQSCVIALSGKKPAENFVDCAFNSGYPSYNPYLEKDSHETTFARHS